MRLALWISLLGLFSSTVARNHLVAAERRAPAFISSGARGFGVVADAGLLRVFVKMAPPGYPYEGRRYYWSGSGIFRAFVNPAGKVTDVTVVKSTGHRALDDSVILAARHWRAKEGRPREVDFSMTFVAPPRRGMPGYGP